MCDIHAKTAKEMNVMMAVSTDAHSIRELDFMTLAVAQARRAWLTKDNLLNCNSYEDLLKWKL